MARKKQPQAQNNQTETKTEQQTEQSRQFRQQYAQQAMNNVIQQHEAARAEKNQLLDHEAENKDHDAEFSEFADGKGNETLNVIGEDQVKAAYEILMKYKEEKSNLDRGIEENERFWKMRHWEEMSGEDDQRIKPKSGWLVNTIMNKHADAMDNYPEANILPRSKDDVETAKMLSSVIPVILEQNDFEKTYSDEQWYKLKNGTGVYGVFWDNDLANGLGDVKIEKIDVCNLYYKGAITDIQSSPNLFYVTFMDDDEIRSRWPAVKPGYGGALPLSPLDHYHDDENIDTSNQSPVIDWYYRKRIQTTDDNGIIQTRTVLHFCKFCNGQVLYASENDPEFQQRGWYDHGKYPFIFDVLFPVEGSVTGFGYIDLIKDDQCYIDKLQQAILENAVANARPRYAVRSDGGLNEKEFTDLSKPIIHFDGNLGENDFRQIVASPLGSIYETVYQNKIQEMKDTSGNTASSQGQTSSVTSASGIASLQEAAGKLSRDTNKGSYRAYKAVVDLVIETIRQFYTEPRAFRITGDDGQQQFVNFDNRGIKPQSQGGSFGIDLGSRLPIMDIDVKPQKKNAYTKESQNQTALNLYNLGFFSPQNSDASLACLEMMDFDQIARVKERVQANGTLYDQLMQMQQQMLQLTQIVDAQNGTNLTAQAGAQTASAQADGNVQKKGSIETSKGSLSSQAASATRGSTAVQ